MEPSDINSAYQGQEANIQKQLETNGFVLLAELFENPYDIDSFDAWKKDVVADMHAYQTQSVPDALAKKCTAYVQTILSKSTLVWSKALKIGKGDFTLQHDTQPPKGLLGAYFLTDGWDAQAFRGELTVAKDQPLLIPPQHNALALVERTSDDRMFIKKVTHHAQKNNYTVVLFVWE